MQGIFLNISDVALLNGVGYRQAVNIYNDIRESLGKPTRKKITVEEYAVYEMVPPQMIIEKLKTA